MWFANLLCVSTLPTHAIVRQTDVVVPVNFLTPRQAYLQNFNWFWSFMSTCLTPNSKVSTMRLAMFHFTIILPCTESIQNSVCVVTVIIDRETEIFWNRQLLWHLIERWFEVQIQLELEYQLFMAVWWKCRLSVCGWVLYIDSGDFAAFCLI